MYYALSAAHIAPTGQQCVSFDVNMYGTSMGTLSALFYQQIFYGTVQEVIWESEPNISPNSTSWQRVNIDLFNIDTRNNYFVSMVVYLFCVSVID
jgi:MAM domain.